ncbi:hypothetical protein Tco_1436388 [Tanacetum coccineum]
MACEEPKTSKNQGVEPTTEHHEGVQIKSIPPEVGPVIEENVVSANSWERGLFSLLFVVFVIISASYQFKEGLEDPNWSRHKLLSKNPIDGREDEYVWLEAINTPDDLYMRHGMYAWIPIQIYGPLVPDVKVDAELNCLRLLFILLPRPVEHYRSCGICHLNQFKRGSMKAPPIDELLCTEKDQPKQEMTLLEQLLLQSIEEPMLDQKHMEVYKKVGQILHKRLDINNKSKHEFKISNFTM